MTSIPKIFLPFKILASILLQLYKIWYNDHYGHFSEQRIETENHTVFFS